MLCQSYVEARIARSTLKIEEKLIAVDRARVGGVLLHRSVDLTINFASPSAGSRASSEREHANGSNHAAEGYEPTFPR